MPDAIKILFATTEAVPYIRVGGLSDVAASLPPALKALGVDVTMIMPLYRGIDRAAHGIEDTGETLSIQVNGASIPARLLRKVDAATGVTHLFVEQSRFFDREQPYTEAGRLFDDSAERFIFFSRVVLEVARRLGTDLIHCNDWFTALVPVFLKEQLQPQGILPGVRTLLTIHNLAYQGRFWAFDWHLLGLSGDLFQPKGLEFYGDINFLKGGILWADAVNTVSPTYAQQIRTANFGCGLEGVISEQWHKVTGILNGIDTTVWNPATDAVLTPPYQTYGPDSLDRKAANKEALQRALGLAVSADRPLLALITRLYDQKGVFLVQEILDWILPAQGKGRLPAEAQLVVLGEGEPHYEEWFRWKAGERPDKLAFLKTTSDDWAHRILAGSDLFLMPSAFEPCGLTQLFAQRYGTLPIVHDTGGLRDTVVDIGQKPNEGTGFKMAYFSGQCLFDMIAQAVTLMGIPAALAAARRRGMARDFSWNRSAEQYIALYRRILEPR